MGVLYDKLNEFVGFDTLQVFGNTGSCKTRFALQAIKEYSEQDKKCIYIDTERNLLAKPENCEYNYYSDFKEMIRFVCGKKDKKGDYLAFPGLQPGFDLVVLDSMGAPALGEFAQSDARQKGDILLDCEALSYELKRYCQKNNALAIVLNQPESDFNKSPYQVRRPFGDKAQFFYKEIWKSKIIKQEPAKTVCQIDSFRSRFTGRKNSLFEVSVTNKGVEVEWVADRVGVPDSQSGSFWDTMPTTTPSTTEP